MTNINPVPNQKKFILL